MSFKLFIYYCGVCGGWAAFLAWALVWAGGLRGIESPLLSSAAIAGVLGLLLGLGVGAADAFLNATGVWRLVRIGVGSAVGFFGGLLSGFVGEGLYQAGLPTKVPGWMLVGVAIGASVAVYDILRSLTSPRDIPMALGKLLKGAAGGLIGGLVGGLLFDVLVGLELGLPNWPLAFGLVILGTCIGLLIGLAQVILKEAWLRIESGFRAGRELILSKNETTVGRAESCDIGLFGDTAVEKLHARILLERNRYFLADAGTPGGTFLNGQRVVQPTPLRSGDLIGVGKSTLRFRERQKRK